jgi:hypothetical protein
MIDKTQKHVNTKFVFASLFVSIFFIALMITLGSVGLLGEEGFFRVGCHVVTILMVSSLIVISLWRLDSTWSGRFLMMIIFIMVALLVGAALGAIFSKSLSPGPDLSERVHRCEERYSYLVFGTSRGGSLRSHVSGLNDIREDLIAIQQEMENSEEDVNSLGEDVEYLLGLLREDRVRTESYQRFLLEREVLDFSD